MQIKLLNKNKSKSPSQRQAAYRKLHRLLAYFVAFTLFWLTLSGVLLNHTEDLKLNKVSIQNPLLLKWYGIAPIEIKQAFALPNNQWLLQVDEQHYWNERKLNTTGELHTVMNANDFIVALTSQQAIVLTTEGDLVETITLPDQLKPSNQSENVLLQSNEKLFFYTKNYQAWWILNDFSTFSPLKSVEQKAYLSAQITMPTNSTVLPAIKASTPNKHIAAAILENSNTALTLEKIILELHNGYFFGKAGSWALDIIALIFLIMIISGIRLHLKK